MYIHALHKFHVTYRSSIMRKSIYVKSFNHKLVPIEWQLILMNEGSLTRHLICLNGYKIKTEMTQEYMKTSKKTIKNLRVVWLKNKLEKLIFARSL
uniref:Uncharacterized protein n=1 Tax=Spyridia filamentosa TaxID=196632 RepID=A0A1Z1MJ93_SPYFI|nr:hypothetical protein [Spyridia filamentosa]ARW66150.1 hypothetical protein [Spyridia filamentosa]